MTSARNFAHGAAATAAQRLATGGRIDRSRTVHFTFDGRTYSAHPGDTLASALLAHGVRLVARSWKYHRPRGVMAAGVDEPCALVQLFDGAHTVPNARMTEVDVFDGLVAQPIHAWPSLRFDLRAMNDRIAALIPAGFYYKTFMASRRAWHLFEPHIRRASGLGESPRLPDPDVYAKRFAHVDVLVVGGGAAGLAAALAAGRAGARVMLCDEQAEPGGWLLSAADNDVIDGLAPSAWRAQTHAALMQLPNVQVLERTTAFGLHDHQFVTLAQRLTDHVPPAQRRGARERLWKVRARQIVLATGSHERPIVFAGNDLPGVMLAGAVSVWLRRYAVRPGARAVVFTLHEAGVDAALALADAGVPVEIVDGRLAREGALEGALEGPLTQQARSRGITVHAGHVVVEAEGRGALVGVQVAPIDADGGLAGPVRRLACDLLAVSGGASPVLHLYAQAGGRPAWSDPHAAFLAGTAVAGLRLAGAARGLAGLTGLAAAVDDGRGAGEAAAQQALADSSHDEIAGTAPAADATLRPLWRVPHPLANRAPKQFVDLQNDVTAADLLLAVREGFASIEHVKRYTALGFGTDQGKTGNINGMGIVAQALGRRVPEVGTTSFRPNYTPVTFGALAGLELGDGFDPVRTTPMHTWHVAQAAPFEDVGQWKRAWFYPRLGEDLHAAVAREVIAVRRAVGLFDASTLGKIDLQGPDAAVLLDRVYTNGWRKLDVGRCRYGLMLDENGMVFDDGVTVRLAEHRYLMHTTTGGAPRVLAWLERWLQTEWPDLRVHLTSVTDHWATAVVAGPRARDVLRAVSGDIDFDDVAFPFMSWRGGTVAGVAARVMRISFSGERSYEVNVAADHGPAVWNALFEAGQPHGITPYGTETMHVLRAEKGFIIVGQDTDGSVSPLDLGMAGLVSSQKDFLGKRSLSRSDTARPDRKQWVGLMTEDPQFVLPEGAQVLDGAPTDRVGLTPSRGSSLQTPVTSSMAGHITSSYHSPTLGRSIALGLVRSGRQRIGERVAVALRDGRTVAAVLASPVFYDPEGARQHA